jgi:hypothetical protein
MQGRTTIIERAYEPGYYTFSNAFLFVDEPHPRFYEPMRYFKGDSTRFQLEELITRYFDPHDKYLLIAQLKTLPEKFIRLFYEMGLEILIVNPKFSERHQLHVRERTIHFTMQSIFGIRNAGTYLYQGRILILNNKVLRELEWYVPFYLLAKAIEQAVLTNPKIATIRPEYLQPDSSLALPHILEVALEKSTTYFYECFHLYFNERHQPILKQRDRVMFRLFQALERTFQN